MQNAKHVKGEHEMLRNLTNWFCFCLIFVAQLTQAQTTFTRITDTSNPIVADAPAPGYPGASWVDYDNDGRLDLSITGTAPNRLYRNLGNGNFQSIQTIVGLTQPIVPGSGGGHSWADYDNDGDLDVCVTGATTFLYRNDGGGNFARVLTGILADSIGNRGWACAWGDYDQDGDVDLVVSHPAGFFAPGSTPNVLLRNDGAPNYTFTKIDTGAIVSQGFQPYTVGSFVDYDLDNDLDFFIGSGPATATPAVDFLHQNMKSETGTAFFRRITINPIATDVADGQNWNWIDIDNDGDLDGYRSNYGGSGSLAMRRNDLYRNDNGAYVKVTTGAIVTDQDVSLVNLWGDFDNDGDIDCFTANESGVNRYYDNNGSGTFTSITTGDLVTTTANHHAATAGDYDGDGDLDLFVHAPPATPNGKGLFRNSLSNGNAWVNILCVGTNSDRAGIGTKIRAKATIGGRSVWQIREVSSQNSFNGANMLNVHFGFGNATVIDSLEIRWERGLRQMFTNIAINRHYRATEGQTTLELLTDVSASKPSLPKEFTLRQNYPNPFNPSTQITYDLPTSQFVNLEVHDILGRLIVRLVHEHVEAGNHTVTFDASAFASGVFFYRLTVGGFTQTRQMQLTK